MADIEQLKAAILKFHGCAAEHAASVLVHEVFQGKTVWQGVVEVFDLQGHPRARRCYAWSHIHGDKDNERRFVAVLEIPPVDSPLTAVRAAIVEEFKS